MKRWYLSMPLREGGGMPERIEIEAASWKVVDGAAVFFDDEGASVLAWAPGKWTWVRPQGAGSFRILAPFEETKVTMLDGVSS